MTYCTLDDVNNGGFFKYDLSQTTTLINKQPAPTVINTDIIPQVDGMIDDALRMYYVTPIDTTASPISAVTLKRIAKWYVAAEIASRIYLQQSPSESQQAQTWKTLADEDIQSIRNGVILLPDAVLSDDSPDKKSDLITDNLSGVGGGPTYPPKFSWRRTQF